MKIIYTHLFEDSKFLFVESASYYAPSIKWVPPTQQVALLHKQWRVKCIFAGKYVIGCSVLYIFLLIENSLIIHFVNTNIPF